MQAVFDFSKRAVGAKGQTDFILITIRMFI